MAPERLTLDGCSPTPLASYLKALGVLRLLSSAANNVSGEAADPGVRGWWEGERFHLRTVLGRHGLLEFFLDEYAPSPVIAPWNGGSGFYPKDNRDGFGPMSSDSVAERFQSFSLAIRVASETLMGLDLRVRPQGDAKATLVAMLRARLPESALPWVDAALVLSGGRLRFPQLLGTGGNDGRLDFTNNLMRRLVSDAKSPGIFDASSGAPSPTAKPLLESALWNAPIHELTTVAVGQYSPGGAGGPNSTTGYEGGPVANPWDYVLMLEGAATFACAATRRHQSNTIARASFPFTVGAVGAGWGGIEATDESDARAEFWAPLWSRPARFCEIEALFGEGRAITNGQTARDGLEFARALATLGVSRGFSEFQRYGFYKRAGKNHYATAIARRRAAQSPGAELVADLDRGGWLNRARRLGRSDNQPAKVRNAAKVLEDSLFELLAPDVSYRSVGAALETIGRLANWLSTSPNGREMVPPPPLLSRAWLLQADDGSPEFRIAAALASLGLSTPARGAESGSGESHPRSVKAPPMAAHFAPLTNGPGDGFEEKTFFRHRWLRKRRAWAGDNNPPTVVWGHGGLVANMIAVLERRLVEAPIRGLTDKPLSSASFARMSDVAAFLTGDFDDARCSALLAGMVWVLPVWLPNKETELAPTTATLPFAYSVVKPIFSPNATLVRVDAIPGEGTIPIPPGLVGQLRGGGANPDGRATDAAVSAAFARARASGLSSPYDPIRSRGRHSSLHSGRIGVGLRPDRLAAALLIPVTDKALTSLLRRAYPGAVPDTIYPTEETQNGS